MKKLINIPLLILLLMTMSNQCFGMMSIAFVSKERAKELGIELRVKESGTNDVWVELEFKPQGELNQFDHVSVEIREGDKFLMGYAPLKEKRSNTGIVSVRFLANRVFLEKITLSIVVGEPMNYSGYELKVKDFVEEEKPQAGNASAIERAIRQLYVGMTESEAIEILKPVSMDWGRIAYGGTGGGELYFQINANQQMRLGIGPNNKKSRFGTSDESLLSTLSPGPEFFVNYIGPVESERKRVTDKEQKIIDVATPEKDVR